MLKVANDFRPLQQRSR